MESEYILCTNINRRKTKNKTLKFEYFTFYLVKGEKSVRPWNLGWS